MSGGPPSGAARAEPSEEHQPGRPVLGPGYSRVWAEVGPGQGFKVQSDRVGPTAGAVWPPGIQGVGSLPQWFRAT